MILRFTIFAILILNTSFTVVRAEDLCTALPTYIKLKLEPEEIKDKFTLRPSESYEEVLRVYKELHSKYTDKFDSAEAMDYCNQQFKGKQKPEFNRIFVVLPKKDITVEYQSIMERTVPVIIPQPTQTGFNPANAHCDKKKVQGPVECGEIDPNSMGLPKNFVELEQIYSWRSEGHADRFSQESCYCLQKKTPKEKLDPKVLDESKKNLNDLILKNAATNILNDYSAQFENVNFYLTNYPEVLKDGRTDVGQQAQLLCNDPALVEAKVNERCKDYGTSPELREERLKLLFGSKGKTASKPSIKDYMQLLDSDIFNVVKAGAGKKSLMTNAIKTLSHVVNKEGTEEDKNLTRRNYDQVRFMYINSQPETVFIDTMLTHLMDDPKLEDLLMEKVFNANLPPHLVLKGIFEENSNSPEMKKVIEKTKQDLKQIPIFQKDPKVLESFYDRLKAPKEFEKVLTRGMNAHPGLKILLSDEDLLDDIHRSKRNGKSFLEFMQKDKVDLIDHLDTGCQYMRSKIAEFVCTQDDKIISKTNRFELKEIIAKADQSLGDPDVLDLAVCREPDPKVRDGRSAFTDLDLSMRPIISDYTLKKRAAKPDELPVVMTLKNLEKDKDLQNYTVAANTDLIDPASRYSLSEFSTPGGGGFAHLASPNSFSIGNGAIEQLAQHRNSGFSSSGPGTGTISGSQSSNETHIASGNKMQEAGEVAATGSQNFQQTIQNQIQNGIQPQQQTFFQAPLSQPTQVNREIASEVEEKDYQETISPKNKSLSPAKQELADILGDRIQSGTVKENMSHISDKDAVELVKLRQEREADKKLISDLQLAAEKKETERLRKEYQDLDQKYQSLLKGQGQSANGQGSFIAGADKLGGSLVTPEDELKDRVPQSVTPGQANFNPSKTGQNIIADPRLFRSSSDKGGITVDLRQNVDSDREEEVLKIVESTNDGKLLEDIQKSGMTYIYKVKEGEKEKDVVETIAFKDLNPKIQELVKKKLEKIKHIGKVEAELMEAQRKFAVQALRLELLLLDHQAKRRSN